MISSRLVSYSSVAIALMSLVLTVPLLSPRRLRLGFQSTAVEPAGPRSARRAYAFRNQNLLVVYAFPILAIILAFAFANVGRILPTDQNQAVSHLRLAEQASARGDFERAANEYKVVLSLDPASVEAYIGRGIARRKLGRFEGSISDLTTAIKLQPGNASAYLNRGRAHLGTGAFKLAILDFTRTIRYDKTSTEAYLNRGWAYRHMGRPDAALRDFDHAVLLEPKLSVPYLGRGVIYASMGQTRLARADLRRAIRLSADPFEEFLARRQLAELTAKPPGKNRSMDPWVPTWFEPSGGA